MSKHKPWNLEIYRGFDSDFKEDQLLVNQPIREFLESEDKFFLVGAKGLGKTLFLRYKSYLYHNQYGGYDDSQTELTDNLALNIDTFSKEDLLQFRDENTWRLIWELALWIKLFRLINSPINPRLDKLINSSEQLSSILTQLLNHRSKVDQYRSFVNEFIEQKKKIQSAVVLFIDDVDQEFHRLLEESHFSDYEGTHPPSIDVWVNAQIGLIGAVYTMSRQNAHIKIFATIRREAFEAYEGQLKINYLHHISMLNYTKSEIKQIFEKNIHLIEPASLVNRYAHTPIQKFIGFDEMPHSFAVDASEKRRVEDAFNFIYRHTYGRPRDIILVGQALNTTTATAAYRDALDTERFEQVRAAVNGVSNYLFQQYTQEIVPYWDENRQQEFVETVRSNVIAKDDFRLFDPDLLRQYYNLGLLGFVKPVNHLGTLRQEFKPPATYNYRRRLALPDTEFLVIHSTMDKTLLERHTYGSFHNPYNIIGDGYDFYPKVDNPIYNIEHYLPKQVTGNRWFSANSSGGHDFPLEAIYRSFFDFNNAVTRHERFQLHWRTAEQVLGLLGRICYCHRLEKQFANGFYASKQQECANDMERHLIRRNYNAEIPDVASDQAHSRFLDRMVGRYITLVCYLVLDLRLEWIHDLLTKGNFKFTFNPNSKEREKEKSTALAYIARGFFISDLKSDEPRSPEKQDHLQIKQHIFDSLSDFEKSCIRTYARNASDEINYLGWIENPEHKTWLRENVLDKMWRPH